MRFVLIFSIYFSPYLFEYGDSAKILGFFFIPSISHQKIYQPIWRELSLRGHQVTVLATDVLNDPSLTNLTEIDAKFAYDYFKKNNYIPRISSASDIDNFQKRVFSHDVFLEIILSQFEHEPFKKIIEDKSSHFDLVLVECLHPLPIALGAKFKAPVIGITSLHVLTEIHDALGNPVHPVLHPEIFAPMDEQPTFFQRLYNFLYVIRWRLYHKWIALPHSDKLAKKYFGEDIPYLGDLEKNLSLVITSINPFTHGIRPNVPRIIEVSQLHTQKKYNPLPDDLQKFLDSSPEGVIYFSFGSNVQTADLSPQVRNTVIETLSELPYKVIWKWEHDTLPNQPKNVLIGKWLPQMDILGHPNVKAFITQAGSQSVEEAIANEVPMIAVPIHADQFGNSKKISQLGMAITLDIRTLTKSAFLRAILEVAGNKKYRENVRKSHQLINDLPMAGLEKAIWWIEYVLRHGGTPHFKNPAVDLPFYQYYSLDVLGFLALLHILILVLIFKAVQLRKKNDKKLKLN